MSTNHYIKNGEASEILSKIDNESVDLILTSPPYPMIEMWDDIFNDINPKIINNYSINYRTTLNNWLTRSGARFAALLGLAPLPSVAPGTAVFGEDLRPPCWRRRLRQILRIASDSPNFG